MVHPYTPMTCYNKIIHANNFVGVFLFVIAIHYKGMDDVKTTSSAGGSKKLYYNNERISLKLKGMSPVQYRAHSQIT